MRVLKRASNTPVRSRILLLSYHFPPSETAGALRWQRLSHLLDEHGWALDVLTNDLSSVTSSGRRALEGLPATTRVFGIAEGQVLARKYTKSLSKRLHSLRQGWEQVAGQAARESPDRKRSGSLHRSEIAWRPFPESMRRAYGAAFRLNLEHGWARAAGRAAERLIESRMHDFDVIVTCGPPHMVHVAGLKLHRMAGTPFVMDMRDPWRFVERLPEAIASPVWLGISRFLEDRCVRDASLVVTNTEPAAELLRHTYPGPVPFLAVRNGSDFVRSTPDRDKRPFVVAFAGSIYLDRDPGPLFEAAARLVRERGLDLADLQIVLVGNVHEFNGIPVQSLAEAAGIGEYLRLVPSVPRDELVEILEKASVLVSLPQDSDLAIPSKIFEYAEYPAWLLAISDPDSATGRLLGPADADLVPPGSSAAIYEVLDRRLRQFRDGIRPTALARDPRFGRSGQAALLVRALEAITERATH